MLGELLLRSLKPHNRIILSSSVITLQLFFDSVSFLRFRFYSIIQSKGNFTNSKTRENYHTR
jgi:hypothetical protein